MSLIYQSNLVLIINAGKSMVQMKIFSLPSANSTGAIGSENYTMFNSKIC